MPTLFLVLLVASNIDAVSQPNIESTATEKTSFNLNLGGYLRMEAAAINLGGAENASNPNVGKNDGFLLGGARLNIRGKYGDRLAIRLSFDGALVEYNDPGDPVGRLDTGLRDAYAQVDFQHLGVIFGRFKPPFDAEELTPTRAQFFVKRSLESRGVVRHEGPQGDAFGNSSATGFAPNRQLGLMGQRVLSLPGDSRLGVSAAITNGNAGQASLNDNEGFAYWLRTVWSTHWGASQAEKDDEEGPATYMGVENGIQLGLSFSYDKPTFGTPPNRFRDEVLSYGADLSAHFRLIRVQGQLLYRDTSDQLRFGTSSVKSLGGHIQLEIAVPMLEGLGVGYRFAFLNPRWRFDDPNNVIIDNDRVMHHTLGVRYRVHSFPMVAFANYTLSEEQAGRALSNDRVEFAVQVDF